MPAPVPTPDSGPIGVLLPCTQEEFGRFISNLLGRPQKIRRIKDCTFDLARSDIENVYHLVDQRVSQNGGTLIEFTATISYNDHSSVELKSLEELLHYREVRSLISRSLSLAWTYLIHFPGTKAPERQSIELNFTTNGLKAAPGSIIIGERPFPLGSAIFYEIAHTSRTWGADIESLLNGHIETLVQEETGLKKLIYTHSGWIGLFASLIFMLLVVVGALVAANGVAASISDATRGATGSATSIPELSAQLQQITEVTANGTWHRFNFLQGVYFILSLIVSVVLGLWVASKADNRPSSFLLLTDKAVVAREKQLKARGKDWF
jgi:hypothetical protein